MKLISETNPVAAMTNKIAALLTGGFLFFNPSACTDALVLNSNCSASGQRYSVVKHNYIVVD